MRRDGEKEIASRNSCRRSLYYMCVCVSMANNNSWRDISTTRRRQIGERKFDFDYIFSKQRKLAIVWMCVSSLSPFRSLALSIAHIQIHLLWFFIIWFDEFAEWISLASYYFVFLIQSESASDVLFYRKYFSHISNRFILINLFSFRNSNFFCFEDEEVNLENFVQHSNSI